MFRKLAGFFVLCLAGTLASAGNFAPHYRVLSPITHGNLTVFPVVADSSHDTSAFLTLDEGLRSGDVVVTEAGRAPGLIRGHRPIPIPRGGAEVNRLVLINNSGRPLLLLAGEIVTGGKQDRVIGKDRIVPPHSDPVDLSVFCVEPGRWTETSAQFKGLSVQMAQPSVRQKAMARKDQREVWNSVAESRSAVVAAAPAASASVGGTSSYATVMNDKSVQEEVDKVAAPIEREYRSLIGELRQRNAVGVVVAVRGRIIWADLFASPALLERYWPKLVRSYAAEAFLHVDGRKIDVGAAQTFLNDMNGRREISETDPGIFRHTEITGDGYKVFELTSLLPKTGFEVHIAKMAE
jgi:hypothetical protein